MMVILSQKTRDWKRCRRLNLPRAVHAMSWPKLYRSPYNHGMLVLVLLAVLF